MTLEPGNQGDQNKRRREFTVTAVLLGIILSIVMGAANVYLGLRAGMTVSASIPAAVIAMGILQGVFRRKSILESNMVQTGASAGESLAAGIIFTMPALVLVGVWDTFNFWITTMIAMTGGLLGILFMIPMRKVFVVDNKELKYPEGLACAEVLRAGESHASDSTDATGGTKLIFWGLLVGALFKFVNSFVGLIRHGLEWATFAGNRVLFLGMDASPALIAVGVIVGLPIAVQIFLGGFIGWLIAIPMLGADLSEAPIDAAYSLWSTQVRYIGVGTMVMGGIVSIWRVRKGLVEAVRGLKKEYVKMKSGEEIAITEKNMSGNAIFLLSLVCIVLTASVYYYVLKGDVGITVLITIIMVIMAFFFTAVASYIVGLVGNSNSPVSGMTISTVLVTGLMIYIFGYSGEAGIIATLGVAGVVCCVACTSGDVCNDLKTGYLVGASPRYQQFMQIIGVLVASFIMAPVLIVLHEGSLKSGGGGIGGGELPAPQAKLFASLADGFFGNGQLPWDMIGWGILIGVIIIIIDAILSKKGSEFRLHLMPVAVGIYLPLGLSTPILLGGIINAFLRGQTKEKTESYKKRGVLISSGLIAGESIVGVLLGFLAYMEFQSLGWGEKVGTLWTEVITATAIITIVIWIITKSKREQT